MLSVRPSQVLLYKVRMLVGVIRNRKCRNFYATDLAQYVADIGTEVHNI